MLRALGQRLCAVATTSTSLTSPRRAGYKNFVNSDALSQLERQCEQYCYVPRVPPRKVAIIGAGSDVGRVTSWLLKQQKVVKVLAMYDEFPERGVIGAAHDIAHIDTSTAVEAYQGRPFLKDALYDSDVVLICGGYYVLPPCCNIMDRDLFFQNMQWVRTAAIAVAHFCPQAILCVQTPPVDCNFALCKYTLEQYDVYDKRRLIGVNSINSMRANQLFSEQAKVNPEGGYVPVICGTGRCTRVPVFSASKSYFCCPQDKIPCLVRLVREADELICRVKSNYEQAHLSIGFSTARCIVNIMQGLFERSSFLDSALVEQDAPGKCYDMPICATPVMMGKKGIAEYQIPILNADEKELLEDSKCDLEDMLNLGRCYAVGDDYTFHPDKICKYYYRPPCPVCKESPPTDEMGGKVCDQIIGEPPKEKKKKKKKKVCKHIIGESEPDGEKLPCDDLYIGEPQSVRRKRALKRYMKERDAKDPITKVVCDQVIGEPKKPKKW